MDESVPNRATHSVPALGCGSGDSHMASLGAWVQTTTHQRPARAQPATGGKSMPPQWCSSSIESRSCCPRCLQLNRPWSGLRVDHWRPSHSLAMPIQRVSRIDSEEFRVLVLRRLRLPLPLSVRSCRCGRLLDVLGHHRAACSTAGVLGRS